MAQEPKKRHSRARKGKRRAHISLTVAQSITCENCGKTRMPHRACKHCGFYKNQQVK